MHFASRQQKSKPHWANATSPDRVSSEIDYLTNELKRRVSHHREQENKDINRWYFRLLKPFFSNYTVLGKSVISSADFIHTREELSIDYLYDKLQHTIEMKYAGQLTSEATEESIFGQYDDIVPQIATQGRHQGFLISLLVVIFHLLHYTASAYCVQLFTESDRSNFLFRLLLMFSELYIGDALSKLGFAYLNHRVNMLISKRQQIFSILIYYKLIISDLGFLQTSDNSLIYRLLYWDLADYSNYVPRIVHSVEYFAIVLVSIFGALSSLYDSSNIYFSVNCILLHAFCYLVLTYRVKFILLYRKILIKERSIMYELLRNYKEVMHSNLKGKFHQRLAILLHKKNLSLCKIHMLENANHLLNQMLLVSIPVLTCVESLIYHWEKAASNKDFSLKYPGFEKEVNYLGLVLLMGGHYYIHYLTRNLYPQIEARGRHQVSKAYYDKFFKDDCVVRRSTILDEELPLGHISIQESEVYERESFESDAPMQNLFIRLSSKPQKFSVANLNLDPEELPQPNLEFRRSKTEAADKLIAIEQKHMNPDKLGDQARIKQTLSQESVPKEGLEVKLQPQSDEKTIKFGERRSNLKKKLNQVAQECGVPLSSDRRSLKQLESEGKPEVNREELDRMFTLKKSPELARGEQLRFNREEAFLSQEEILSDLEGKPGTARRVNQSRIRLVLNNLSLYITGGDIVCVLHNKQTAAISGFIKMLIGENIISKGTVRYNGKFSFFSKDKMPFIVGKTILDNILFGQEYDPERFDEVLEVLQFNFDKYSGREYYQVGEKGLNLKSEDQVSLLLARFLYSKAEIYIIEDLFMDIEQWLMEFLLQRVILGFLKGKTIIYVSQENQMIDAANVVIKFKSGYKYHISYQTSKSIKLQSARSLLVLPQDNMRSMDRLGDVQLTASVYQRNKNLVTKHTKSKQEEVESDSSDDEHDDEFVKSEGLADENLEPDKQSKLGHKAVSMKLMTRNLDAGKPLTATGSIESRHLKISPRPQYGNGPIRLKNTLFLENVTYEEELEVHRRLQLKKKEIDRVITPETNILEKFSYGIFLTNKRRQEGMNIDEIESLDHRQLLKFSMWLLFRSADFKWICRIAVFMRTVEIGLYNGITYMMFVYNWEPITKKSRTSWQAVVITLSYVFLFLLSATIRSLLLSNKICSVALKLHSKILGSLFTSEEVWIQRMKLHDILGKTNEQMQTLDLKLVRTLKEIAEALAWLFNAVIFLIIYYGFGLPILWVGIYIILVLFFIKKLGPAFTKIAAHTYFSHYKKDDFNFQLLSLIFSHRISGLTQKLNNKFIRLTENLFKGENMMAIELPWLIAKLQLFMRFGAVLGGLLNIYLFYKVQELDVFGIRTMQHVWISFLGFQAFSAFESATVGFAQFLPLALNLYRLYSFIELSNAHRQLESEMFIGINTQGKKCTQVEPTTDLNWRRIFDSSLSVPLSMKNVSLTLGYKVVLKKINLRVRAKEIVGILGVDGGGRSAIFDLILGIKRRDSFNNSQIKIFGKPIEEIMKNTLRENIFLATRVPNLFQGTIRDNLDPYQKFSITQLMKLLVKLGLEKILTRVILKNQLRLTEGKLSDKFSNQNNQLREALVDTAKLGTSVATKRDNPSYSGAKSMTSMAFTPHVLTGPASKLGATDANALMKEAFDARSYAKMIESQPRQSIDSRTGALSIDGKLTMNPNIIVGIGNGIRATEQKNRKHIIRIAEALGHQVEAVQPASRQEQKVVEGGDWELGQPGQSGKQAEESMDMGDWQLGGSDKDTDKPDLQGQRSSLESKSPGGSPQVPNLLANRANILFQLDSDHHNDKLIPPTPIAARVEKRSASATSLDKGENIGTSSKSKTREQQVPNLVEFLNIKVSSLGQNIDKTIRKIIAFARVLLEKPALLLIYEDSMNWGQGIRVNLELLRELSPNTAVLSITRSNSQVLCYDKILLLDGGVAVDCGNPVELIGQETSPLCTYLKETEGKHFEDLLTAAKQVLPAS